MDRTNLSGSLAVLALASAVLVAPLPARADRDRPLYAGFGGGIFLDLDCCEVHGRVSGAFGWHFDREDTGFVMAVEAQATFGPNYWMLYGGLRLGGDIEVTGNYRWGILLRPSGLFGVGVRDFDGPDNASGVFVFSPAFDIRFVFADRVIAFWLRPVSFDFVVHWDNRPSRGDWWWSPAYVAMAGLDFQF